MNVINNALGKFQGEMIETPQINDKELLQIVLGEATRDVLNGQYFVIIVPSLDEWMCPIYSADKTLFHSQQEDAHVLAQHMMISMGADLVTIITDYNKVDASFDNVTGEVSCVILLHEFIDFEKNTILEKLEKQNADFEYFELRYGIMKSIGEFEKLGIGI